MHHASASLVSLNPSRLGTARLCRTRYVSSWTVALFTIPCIADSLRMVRLLRIRTITTHLHCINRKPLQNDLYYDKVMDGPWKIHPRGLPHVGFNDIS
jgi:hypothetical protein